LGPSTRFAVSDITTGEDLKAGVESAVRIIKGEKIMQRFFMSTFVVWLAAICFVPQSHGDQPASLKLERHAAEFFSIQKPQGWRVITAGHCSTFAFLIHDPEQPLRQIFHFGEVGPVYLSRQQKQIDRQYMQMGGYPVSWIEMPVVQPLTPGNFLRSFHLIARTKIAQHFMPQCPRLDNLQVISTADLQSPIAGGRTELLRAIFSKGDKVGEGFYVVTVAPMLGFTGAPGAGIGYGFLFTGITAPKEEFRGIKDLLVRSIGSYTINRSYVDQCLRQQAANYAGLLKAGRTLSETSDIIMQGWESRNKSYDIVAEKRSDALLGRERLYNPDTGEVFEFENGFYDQYRLDRNRYEMSNLQPLPDDAHGLWMQAPLDGYRHLR
jgi:hypothetical protein